MLAIRWRRPSRFHGVPKTDRKQSPLLTPILVPTIYSTARTSYFMPRLSLGGISKTLLKMRDVFMSEIHTFMDAQDLNKEEGQNTHTLYLQWRIRLPFILCSCPVRRGSVRCRRNEGDRRNEEDTSQTTVGQIQKATTHIRKEISLTVFHKFPSIYSTRIHQMALLHLIQAENTAYAM